MNKKGGFTLVELVVAIAVFAVFSAGVAGVAVPLMNLYAGALQTADARAMAFAALESVRGELTYARQEDGFPVAVREDGRAISFVGKEGETLLSSEDGRLYLSRGGKTPAPFFDEGFYKNNMVAVTFSFEAPTVSAAVEVTDREGKTLARLAGDTVPWSMLGE